MGDPSHSDDRWVAPREDHLDATLRRALATTLRPVDPVHVLACVTRRAELRLRRLRRRRALAAGAAAVVVAGSLSVAGVLLSGGAGPGEQATRGGPTAAISPASPSPARPAAGSGSTGGDTLAPSDRLPASAPGFGVLGPGPHPPSAPAPCPTGSDLPRIVGGRYCGPNPPAGDGSGPGGECTTLDTSPPCGPGVVPGRYYAYTLPGTCSGLVVFDGRQWLSELPPPTPVPAMEVWMALTAHGGAGFISPSGSVGFVPYTGQPLPSCRG